MSKPSFKGIALLFTTLLPGLLGGCASSTSVLNGNGDTISGVQGESYDGARARVVVGRIIDRSDQSSKNYSLTYQLGQLLGEDEVDTQSALGGMRDMLTDAMFQTGRFILLDRELLDAALVEQEFMQQQESATSHLTGKLPPATLEGADLLVVGALTEFDAGNNGGIAFPIPFPLNSRNGDFGILNLQMRTASAAVDIRVIDVQTGRVVSTVAVEGKARKFGAGLTGIFSPGGGYIRLPGILSAFENTPVENALRDMVEQAAQHIASQTPETFFRYRNENVAIPTPP